ncbi:hypothetical protein BHE74_00047326 [Ensete ventricosum]|nr:hypothetical protein BHE74_00047326 [Ensete ventricosum]
MGNVASVSLPAQGDVSGDDSRPRATTARDRPVGGKGAGSTRRRGRHPGPYRSVLVSCRLLPHAPREEPLQPTTMADEILAYSAPAAADRELETTYKETSSYGVEQTAGKEAAANGDQETAVYGDMDIAAAGDRDAAVELLLDEIRALKSERSNLQRERSDLLRDLSDAREKLAGAESDLKAVAGQASRLEGELRVTLDDLSTANLAATEHEEKVGLLESNIKDLEATFTVKVNELEIKVKVLEDELRVAKQKEMYEAEKFAAKEEELKTKIAELTSNLEEEEEEEEEAEKSFEIDGKEDAGVPPMHSRALGAAAVIGVVALGAGAVVCLHLLKRR